MGPILTLPRHFIMSQVHSLFLQDVIYLPNSPKTSDLYISLMLLTLICFHWESWSSLYPINLPLEPRPHIPPLPFCYRQRPMFPCKVEHSTQVLTPTFSPIQRHCWSRSFFSHNQFSSLSWSFSEANVLLFPTNKIRPGLTGHFTGVSFYSRLLSWVSYSHFS